MESDLEAGNLCLAGVLSFCSDVEQAIRDNEPAPPAELGDRIRVHIDSVVERYTSPVLTSNVLVRLGLDLSDLLIAQSLCPKSNSAACRFCHSAHYPTFHRASRQMGNCTAPGPTGSSLHLLDEGTLCRTRTPSPSTLGIEALTVDDNFLETVRHTIFVNTVH